MKLGLDKSDEGRGYARLRVNRGHLLTRSAGTITIVAKGRVDWIGWVELKMEPVNELATQHTAQVLKDINADVQVVVEAESRISLRDFSSIMLQSVGGTPFEHVMLIDGNDDRGIDVGILTRGDYPIISMKSHVDDAEAGAKEPIFSRDCAEYVIQTKKGGRLVVLANHFKSKGYGSQKANDARRKRQAKRVADIYKSLRAAGEQAIVVLGDLNDTPDSAPLAPLVKDTDLADITTHAKFKSDGRPGTFGNGTKAGKIDYILLSPQLFGLVQGGAIFRKGAWGGKNGDMWPHYPTMTSAVQAASDHAALYAKIDF